jgi:hypothetical protein
LSVLRGNMCDLEKRVYREGEYYEGVPHKSETVTCPNCGCELLLLRKVVVDKVRDVLRKAIKKRGDDGGGATKN